MYPSIPSKLLPCHYLFTPSLPPFFTTSISLFHYLFTTPFRDEATRLRAQQDREYQESQEADRLERERQKELQLKKVVEEEEKQQQEELAAAIAMSRQLSFQDRVRKLKAEFATNPEPSLNATGVTTIR